MNTISESTAVVTVGEISARKGAVNESKGDVDDTLNGGESNLGQQKDYLSKQRDRWLNKLSNELLVVFHRFPFPDALPKETCPEWVWWIQQELFRVTYMRLELKHTKTLTPIEMGGFLGYQCAYAVLTMESMSAAIDDAIYNPTKYKNVVVSEEACEKGLNFLLRFDEWYGELRRLAGRALKSCVYQTYADMMEFLSAYSGAFSRKPKLKSGFGNFGNTAFAIYHFMLWNWRVIEGLESVRELHEMLRKYLGEYRVGDLKRIEKICQRAGKHFRKPGRPKASK